MGVELTELRHPIVQAPLAGGPSTPALAAAVAHAGGFGFLAAGYRTVDAVRVDIGELRSLTDEAFGVNVFAPPASAAGDREALERYAAAIAGEAERYSVSVGELRHDDDAFESKLELVINERVPVVSFTFGCPAVDVVEALHTAGSDVWVTITNPEEAAAAVQAGADVLVAQGVEAGGHRGYFVDSDEAEDFGLIALLALVAARVHVPLVAAGGIADGASVAAALCAGAVAAQVGSALMLTPEAGTSEAHRAALRAGGPTALTRAFSGRQARGIVNRFMREHGERAPIAYPDIHHLTTPIRAAARQAMDRDAINLWAGQAYALASEEPAAAVVARLGDEARAVLAAVAARLEGKTDGPS